jgi:hypothetical protein
MMRPVPALLAAIVIVAAACSPGAGSSAPIATVTPVSDVLAPSASSTPVPDVATSTDDGGAASGPAPTATRTPGPFGRHDTPPGGVAAFLEFPGGGALFCAADEPGPPTLRLDLGPFPTAVCAFNFTPGHTVDLLLRGPDGSEVARTEVADEAGIAAWDLADLPDPFEGEYVVRATQADLTVESTATTFTFETLAGMFTPEEIRIGETGRAFVAGGHPGERISAHLYFAPEEGFIGPNGELGYRFTADVGPIELNANREGRMALTPQPGDPTGHYLLVVNRERDDSATPDPAVESEEIFLMFEVAP